MENAFFDLIVGGILPPFIDLINTKISDSRIKFWMSILISVLVAVILNYSEFTLEDPSQFLASVLVVVVSAQAVYKKLYEDSKLQNRIQAGVNKVI